jgi:uncharacterized SAM-binding protein YcdF (DUF218 family)
VATSSGIPDGLDALVVLGCRTSSAGELSPAAARRVARAAAVWRACSARFVVASGGRRWGEAIEAVAMRAALVLAGVPRDRIALELTSLTTADNARCSAVLLARARTGRVGVVTCDWHVDRAVRAFRAVGVDAVAVPAPSPPASAWTRARRASHDAHSGWVDASLRRRAS